MERLKKISLCIWEREVLRVLILSVAGFLLLMAALVAANNKDAIKDFFASMNFPVGALVMVLKGMK